MFGKVLDYGFDSGAGVANQGRVGDIIANLHNGDTGLLRPYIDNKGQACVDLNIKPVFNNKTGEWEERRGKYRLEDLAKRRIYSPVGNATSLRREEWIYMDKKVREAARYRLRAWADMMATNTVGGFDGESKMTFEYDVASDPGEAIVDMDLITDGRTDSPLFKTRSVPLAYTHSDFWYSARRIKVSANGGQPVSTRMGEAAGRRVAEMVEKTLIGTETGISYGTNSSGIGAHDGTSKVYGYTNHPARITYTTITTPTGLNPEATVANVLAMRQTMYNNKFFGPFMIYTSTDWDTYLDNDYARLGGSNANMTLRDRLRAIDDIQDVRRLDFLFSSSNPFTMIMVQMNSETVAAINGMDMTTLQWPSQGGARQNFKTAVIWVPLLTYDYNGVLAVLHGTTS